MKKRITAYWVFGLVIFLAGTVWGSSEDGSNTFFGDSAGSSITTGGSNSFFGAHAGQNNTEGYTNIFVGYAAGYFNTKGISNIFVGNGAGYKNTEGNGNSILGHSAGYYNTTGGGNSFLGNFAGYQNTKGNYNNFFGRSAGHNNTTGTGNSFFGAYAGDRNTEGNYNVLLGYYAGYNETGSNKLYISNSDTDHPLIYGEFGSRYLEVNGDLNVVGYVQLDLTNGSPPSWDCDDPLEYGRMKVDASNELLYICVVSGWVSLEPPPSSCSAYNGDEDSCIANNCKWNKGKQTCD